MTSIRVLLVDDHQIVREGLRLTLERAGGFEVVGEAGDGSAVPALLDRCAPDVIVLDLSMSETGGIAVARRLRDIRSRVRVVVLTRHDDTAYVDELLALDVAGYVLKQSPSSELLTAIRRAAAGGRYLDASIPPRPRTKSRPAPHPTNREIEVLRLIGIGQANKEIGVTLGISAKTVEVHRANVMRKLGLRGRSDVVRYCLLQGWLKDP